MGWRRRRGPPNSCASPPTAFPACTFAHGRGCGPGAPPPPPPPPAGGSSAAATAAGGRGGRKVPLQELHAAVAELNREIDDKSLIIHEVLGQGAYGEGPRAARGLRACGLVCVCACVVEALVVAWRRRFSAKGRWGRD